MTSPLLLTPGQLLERAQQDLDWPILLDRLAGYATSEPGANRLRAKRMETDWDCARLSMLRTEETLSLTEEGNALPVVTLPNMGDLIERLDRSLVASGLELRDLAIMLETSRALRRFAIAQQQARPHLAEHLLSDPALDKLHERLSQAIATDGSIEDGASPPLARLRAKAREHRQELISQLKRLMQTHADLLQGAYFSERDGRYVLPFRADAHRSIEGTVLDTSASGGTLFIEPRELSPISNRLRIAVSDVAHEEQRILAELSELAKRQAPSLRVAENACIEADVLGALARYASRSGAIAVVPLQAPLIALLAARHPLLVDQIPGVVPNNLELNPAQALVISGPNAGGKTVALKAFGLFAMMARAGIPLTVAPGSRIGFFSEIYSEIGDSQSIVSSLSTFSAHILVLSSILAASGPCSLVLLDELAGGTDPEQGAALAAACLECLTKTGSATVATTHYEALKELANSNCQFCNAAVGFDVETMLPSFRLIAGVAGPSTAFAVAKRFGIPDHVLARAGELIPKSSHERESLLEQLSTEREAARVLREDAAKEADEQRRLRVLMDGENEQARATFERKLEQEYRELLGQVRIARTELDNLRKRIVREAETAHELTRGTLSQLERSLDSAAHVVALGSPVTNAVGRYRAPQTNKSLTLDELEVGKIVHLPRLNASAQVVEISRKGTLKVRIGNVVMQTVLAEIEVAAKDAGQPRQQTQSRAIKQPKARASNEPALPRSAPMRMPRNTLELRGERVDAALDRVDAFVDELLRTGEPAGYVLHGHGTGALKQAVRQHVRALSHVAESGPATPEDGGDAFTLLLLSD